MTEKFKIYSFYYLPKSLMMVDECYVPIWAGKNNSPEIDGFIGDDSGDTISEKNKYYSELTGLYWIWKNTKSDIVGSCHYRRYFTTAEEPIQYQIKRLLYYPARLWKKRFGLIYTQNTDFWNSKIIGAKQATKLLDKYDAILPMKRKLKYTVKEHYKRYHDLNDLHRIENILEEQCPEYLNSYQNMLNNKHLFANNMFILKWETFDELMTWLFSILFEFEEKGNLDNYTGYQERIFGFLSERLITLWIIHNKLNYKELPLIYYKKLKKQANA